MFTFQQPPYFFSSDLDISNAHVSEFTPIFYAKKFSNQYHSDKQPLHYENRLLLEKNDIVLHFVEKQGRVVQVEMARVWDTLYYTDGSPIGVALIPVHDMQLKNYYFFNKINPQTQKEEYYFASEHILNQKQIHRYLALLSRANTSGKMWLPEKEMIVNSPPITQPIPYPSQLSDLSESFLQSSVVRYAKMGHPAYLFGTAFWFREQGRDEQAIYGLQKAAEKHFSLAWLELGFEYHEDGMLGLNPDKAVACFRQAAYGGLPLANYQLALAHIDGVGTEQSDSLALNHLQKAKEGGILAAYLALGLYYQNGSFNHLRSPSSPYRQLSPKQIDYKLAAKLFYQATTGELWEDAPIATYHLAECYRKGLGVYNDKNYARELYRLAAQTGNIYREEIQSAAYYNGEVERLSHVAEKMPFAAYLVGRMYWFGEFAPKNFEIAQRYLKMAANSAHSCAADANALLQNSHDFWHQQQ